jgi:methylglutaconyl-CoA hydratase
MSEQVLAQDIRGGVATLTLNRPEKRNALDATLVGALKDALARVERDEAVRVVALRGAGKDFCAGGDLAELERISAMSADENLQDARSLGSLLTRLRALPKPVVAVVHGRALAGGCGLATACDLVLAHEGAELGYPEVHLGFVPAMVMAILRRKVTEGRAFELVTRGHRVGAAEALALGLVNRVFPEASFEADVDRYLRDLAARPASAQALTKGLLYELGDLGFEEGIERGAQVNVEARMTEACREGVRRFLEGHRTGGEGRRAPGGA